MALRKKLRMFCGLIILVFCLVSMSSVGLAEETAFFVQPLIPDNQLEGTVDYFNIGTPPTIDQTLQLIVTNESDDPKTFAITLLDGMTTDEGSISYDTGHDYAKSVKYRFSKFASIPDVLEVEGNGSGLIDLTLNVETDGFIGLLLGAVNVAEVKRMDTSKGGVGNTFAYNIPVKIRVSQEKLTPTLSYQGMTLSDENHQYAIKMTVENPVAEVVRGLTMGYEIRRKDEKKVLVTEERKDLELAPTSLFTPTLSLQNKQLEAGDYVLTIKATSAEIAEEWKSDFTITKKEAEQLNDGFAVAEQGPNWLIWGMIGLFISLVAGGSYYVYRKKNYKALPNTKKRSGKRKKS